MAQIMEMMSWDYYTYQSQPSHIIQNLERFYIAKMDVQNNGK